MTDDRRAGRTLDAKLHAAIFNIPIEWRLCATDPECGRWEDVQWHDEPHQEGDTLWGAHPIMRQPCYNWLDTNEPAQHGWTPEDIANNVYRTRYWRVIPHYSTDISAAWLIIGALRQRDIWLYSLEQHWEGETTRVIFEWRSTKQGLRFAQEFSDTPALAICLAALAAIGGNQDE